MQIFTHPHLARFMKAIQFASQYRVREILTVVISVFSVGMGTSFVMLRQPYEVAFARIDNDVTLSCWGYVLVAVSIMLGLSATLGNRKVMWPALMLFGIYFYFTIITSLVIPDSKYVPPASWGFLLAAMVCALLTAASAFPTVSNTHLFGARNLIITEAHPDGIA